MTTLQIPRRQFIVDAGLVSISHWGAFDLDGSGGLLKGSYEIEWDGERIVTYPHPVEDVMRSVGR